MRTAAVLLAAGRSERFGEDKLVLAVAGGPVWLRSYRTLATHPLVSAVGIVASEALHVDAFLLLPAIFVVFGILGWLIVSCDRRGG